MKKITTITTALLILFLLSTSVSQAVYIPCHEAGDAYSTKYEPVLGELVASTGLTQVTIHKGQLIPHVNLSVTNIVADGNSSYASIPTFDLAPIDVVAEKIDAHLVKTTVHEGERIAEATLSQVEIIPFEDETEWMASTEFEFENPAIKIFEGFAIEIPKIQFNIIRRFLFL